MKRNRFNTIITSLAAVVSCFGLFAQSAFADTIVVYGATGKVGTLVIEEALNRGHNVIGVTRHAEPIQNDHANFSSVQGDVTSADSIAATVQGADTVIVAVGGVGSENTPETAIAYRASLAYADVASQLGDATPYLLQVGSGTTLNVDGVRVFETLDLEPGTRRHGLYQGHWLALESYRQSSGFDWVVMSAAYGSIMEGKGEATGNYRLGDQETLYDRNGSNVLSTPDYAIAVVDMAESHTVSGKRVAVGPPY